MLIYMVLVDSGACVNILSEDIYYSLASDIRPEFSPTLKNITLADGKPMNVKGKADVILKIDDIDLNTEVIIADISCDGILRLDFLRQHNCTLDFSSNRLKIKGKQLSCERVGSNPLCCRVVARETVPGRHEMVISGSVKNKNQNISQGMIEGVVSVSEKHGMLIGKCLVNPTSSTVPPTILNPCDDVNVIYAGTMLALLHPVNDNEIKTFDDFDKENGDVFVRRLNQNENNISLPSHIVDMYNDSCEHLDETQARAVRELLIEFSDIFSTSDTDIGCTNVIQHEICTKDAKPIRRHARRLPIHKQQEADKQIHDMLKMDIIEPSTSPWASPITLVTRKDKKTRFCIDYRLVNACTVKDAYPLPRIDDSLNTLNGAKWFSTIDLASGYWQVGVKPEDRPKTAFITRQGLFQFKVMSFGLCNATATIERLMEVVFRGLQWKICLIYMDDVIIFGRNFEDEITRLRAVFEKLRNANLKLKPKKCRFFRKSVPFLGHIVSENGISTDPDKIKAVSEWPVPVSVTEVRSFLGLASYYRRFIQGFASLAAPLHKLTQKDCRFVWSDDCELSFQTLKNKLVSSPILSYPRESGKFILDTDACDLSIGAVLSQEQDGQEKVIAYASRSLSKQEKKYCVTRKALLAVVFFCKYFTHYLYGQTFLVRTDHNSLRWLFRFKNPEGQTARWLEVLGTFDFEIQHRSWRQHGNADGVSRIPCRQCGFDGYNVMEMTIQRLESLRCCQVSQRQIPVLVLILMINHVIPHFLSRPVIIVIK